MPDIFTMISDGLDSILAELQSQHDSYIPPGFKDFYKEAFDYNIILNPATAGAVTVGSTNVNNDSYFAWVSSSATIWDAATQNTTNTQPELAPLLVKIIDSSSGKYSMDQPTPIGNIFGTAKQPGVWWKRGKLFLPGGQITAEVTNQMAANQVVRLTFTGFKIYKVADSASQM